MEIIVTTRPAKGETEVCIKDNGDGMSHQVLRELGEPRSVINDGEKWSGFGMGLTLTRKLAEENGIELKWDSVVNKGTEATVVFKDISIT